MPNMRTARPQTPSRHRKRSHLGASRALIQRDPLEVLTDLTRLDLATSVVGGDPRVRIRPIKKQGKRKDGKKTG
jgi:hypothetical protein